MSKKGDRTKQFIKEKAKILFAEKGFKIVTMKDICEATGLSRGGLYRHYNSTHVIFSEIISEFLDDQNNLFSESINNNGTVKISRVFKLTKLFMVPMLPEVEPPATAYT